MERSPESLGQILDRVCHDLSWGRRVVEGRAVAMWGDVVGESLRKHTRAVRVKDGKLVVVVGDGMWKQEVSLLRGEIIKKLNEKVGGEVVKDIVLVVN